MGWKISFETKEIELDCYIISHLLYGSECCAISSQMKKDFFLTMNTTLCLEESGLKIVYETDVIDFEFSHGWKV